MTVKGYIEFQMLKEMNGSSGAQQAPPFLDQLSGDYGDDIQQAEVWKVGLLLDASSSHLSDVAPLFCLGYRYDIRPVSA